MKKILLALCLFSLSVGADDGIAKYKKACDSGDIANCSVLGLAYYTGDGVKQDYSKAVEYFKKVCDLGDALSCSLVGVSYYKGNGVKQDYSKAVEYFIKVCDLGDKSYCDTYKNLNEQ